MALGKVQTITRIERGLIYTSFALGSLVTAIVIGLLAAIWYFAPAIDAWKP